MTILTDLLTRFAGQQLNRIKKESRVLQRAQIDYIFNELMGNSSWVYETTDAQRKHGDMDDGYLYIPISQRPGPGGFQPLIGYSQLESGLIVKDWLAKESGLEHEPFKDKASIILRELAYRA